MWRTILITAALLLQDISVCSAGKISITPHDLLTEMNKLNIPQILPDCVFGVKFVSFFLHTRQIPLGKVVQIDDEQIPLRPNKPVVVIVHGFVTEVNSTNFLELVSAWLKKDDVNIFLLDWSDAACAKGLSITDLLSYRSAVDNVPVVSEYLANFIVMLANVHGVKINEVVAAGHSLGAHLVGIAGKIIQRMTQQKYKQIIGLDPAAPEYLNKDCSERLCASDAAFVQIFHTSYPIGLRDPIGHKDFYFNGGFVQPECLIIPCSHNRVVTYLTMSLLHTPCFIATPWKVDSDEIFNWKQCRPDLCTYPGLNVSKTASNTTYYVSTAHSNPYCTL